MSAATWGAVVNQWGPVVTILATLSGIALAWRQTHQASRQGVADDEREARKDAAEERRDTIADRDAMIDQLADDRDHWKARALAAESREVAWIATVTGHVPWDWHAQEIAHEAGRDKDLGVAPPLRPPPEA